MTTKKRNCEQYVKMLSSCLTEFMDKYKICAADLAHASHTSVQSVSLLVNAKSVSLDLISYLLAYSEFRDIIANKDMLVKPNTYFLNLNKD